MTWREYRAQGRYGYIGIDEYHRDREPVAGQPDMSTCARTVLTGIRPQKLGRAIAEALQAAYEAGREDALRAWVQATTPEGVIARGLADGSIRRGDSVTVDMGPPWVQCPGCPGEHLVPEDGDTPGHCPRHWRQGMPQP